MSSQHGHGRKVAIPIRTFAHRIRIYPDHAQAELAMKTFGCRRLLWNLALEQRSTYGRRGRRINFASWNAELKALKALSRTAAWKERAIADKRLCEVSRADVRAVIKERTDARRAANTVRNDLFTLSAVYTEAWDEWELDIANPVRPKDLPAQPPPRQARLQDARGKHKQSHEERLRAALGVGLDAQEMDGLMSLALDTGMRRGEIVALLAGDVLREDEEETEVLEDTVLEVGSEALREMDGSNLVPAVLDAMDDHVGDPEGMREAVAAVMKPVRAWWSIPGWAGNPRPFRTEKDDLDRQAEAMPSTDDEVKAQEARERGRSRSPVSPGGNRDPAEMLLSARERFRRHLTPCLCLARERATTPSQLRHASGLPILIVSQP